MISWHLKKSPNITLPPLPPNKSQPWTLFWEHKDTKCFGVLEILVHFMAVTVHSLNTPRQILYLSWCVVLHLSKGKRWQLRARGVHNIEKLCSIREVSAFMQRPWSANTQRGSMAFSNSYYLSSALLWVAKFHIFLNRKTADIFFRLQIQEKWKQTGL